jgi:hypothetical protein
MSSAPTTTCRSLLSCGAALAAVPAVAALAGGALAEPAFADDTLPDYAPNHDTLMLVDINLPGYQQYVTDLLDGVAKALTAVDPTPFFAKYGNNTWAAVKTYQDAQVDYAATPVIKKYTGVLAAADVYTASTAFLLLESIRLDLGAGSQVQP